MIQRTRLLNRIASEGPVIWLVEAGAGFGKSALLDQLAAPDSDLLVLAMRRPGKRNGVGEFMIELVDAARRARDAELAAELEALDPDARAILATLEAAGFGLAIDNARMWSEEALELIGDLVASASGRVRLLLAGRRCPVPPAGLNVYRIDSGDLAFTAEEITATLDQAEVQGASDIASVLHQATYGWPLAVASSVQRVIASPDPATISQELGSQRNVIDHQVATTLTGAEDPATQLSYRLAALPFFDQEMAQALGEPKDLDRLRDIGLPISVRPDHWSEICEPFRSSLLRAHPPSDPPAQEILDRFIERGKVAPAINLCLAQGARAQVARLVAGLSYSQQTFIEPDVLQAAMVEVGDQVAAAPRCLLTQAQINGSHGHGKDAMRCLEEGARLFAQSDPEMADDGHVELLLELGVWRTFVGDLAAAQEIIDQTVHVSDRSPLLRAKAHELQGSIDFLERTPESHERSILEYTAALEIWRELGETRPAAATAFRLASGSLHSLGRRPEAMAVLDNLPTIGQMSLVNSARLGIERAILMPYLGRADEVTGVLDDVRRTAALLGHDWLVSWAMWIEMTAASVLGRAADVADLYDRYRREGRQQLDDFSQALMWCESAANLARVGHHDRAKAALDLSRDAGLPDSLVLFYDASIMARTGSPEPAARQLEELAVNPEVEPGRRWEIDLLQAYCYWQMGDGPSATKFFEQCMKECRALDQPLLATHIEREIVGLLQAPGGSDGQSDRLRVQLCGDFGVFGPTGPLYKPLGHAATLLKVLILNDRRLTLDQATDTLWPEVAPDVGRRRLRNVLGRLRQTHDKLVVRVDDALELSSLVSSDFGEAQAAVDRATNRNATQSDIERALELLGPELLVEDRYADWAEAARTDRVAMTVRLLDQLAVVCEDAEDPEAAANALERAHLLDPLGGRRPERAATLLRSAGRETAALALLERCR